MRGISDLVIAPGLINVDFADVRTIMTGMGRALMGTGYGKGDKRAVEAAQMAISSPLLEDVSINGATGILINITGGPDLTLPEMNEACSLIAEAAHEEANIIFGSVIDAQRRRRGPHHGHRDRLQHARAGAPGARRRPRPRARARGADGAADAGIGGHDGARGDHGVGAAARAVGAGVVVAHAARWLRGAGAARGRGDRDHQPGRVLLEHGADAAGPDGRAQPPPAPAGEWTPAERLERRSARNVRNGPERPIVRPQTATAPAARGRAQVQSPRPADELGVEESEFDKPAYLRRGLYAPE